jgi:hypothetical protein
MTAFPDLVVKMDNLTWSHVKYYWTITGLTAESEGHFAQAAYQRQLEPWPDKDPAVKR